MVSAVRKRSGTDINNNWISIIVALAVAGTQNMCKELPNHNKPHAKLMIGNKYHGKKKLLNQQRVNTTTKSCLLFILRI